MNDDKVTNFELIKYFLEYFQKTLKSVEKHPDFRWGQSNYHLLSEKAKEASQISKFMSKINDLNSDLKKTETFTRRFPSKEYYRSNDIDQLDFIKYHYEVFIHKIHTLLEVKKLWLNDFYKIGLKERDCNWNNLKLHSAIQKSPAKIIVDSYYKSFKHIIDFRNLNTHRAIFVDSKNEKLKSELFIYDSYQELGIEVDEEFKRIYPKFIIDSNVKKYRKERLNYIKEGAEIAKTYSNYFVTTILTEFFNNKI